MGWRTAAYTAVRPLLFAFDPERIHHATLAAVRVAAATPPGRGALAWIGGLPRQPASLESMGLRFRNRVGLGAGFDKDGAALAGWAALGFGFVEVGTVTPLAQPGNPRPRLVRLADDRALVNRMGFNNLGADQLAQRVGEARGRLPEGFVVGINIGRGRDTPPQAAVDDYLCAYRAVAPVADYVALNVSSPNTPGLRELQHPDELVALVDALRGEMPQRPLVVKLAPDLEEVAFDALIRALAESACAGLVVSNTTVARSGLRSPGAAEQGGLSGAPLLEPMLRAVARARELAGPRLAVVASGGIFSGSDAEAARAAGADLVQLWTGLVYRGPGLIGEAAGRMGRSSQGRGQDAPSPPESLDA